MNGEQMREVIQSLGDPLQRRIKELEAQLDDANTQCQKWYLESVRRAKEHNEMVNQLHVMTNQFNRLLADRDRMNFLSEVGDDCQWANILRVEMDDFESLRAAVDELLGGER